MCVVRASGLQEGEDHAVSQTGDRPRGSRREDATHEEDDLKVPPRLTSLNKVMPSTSPRIREVAQTEIQRRMV